MKNVKKICKLCDEVKPLIEAHIIPEFLYKNLGLYSASKKVGNNLIHRGKIDNGELNTNLRGLSKGIFDKNILCKECDNLILNKEYERYAKEILFDNIDKVCLGNEIVHLKNIDYVKFKLFVLSIFWRASISERKEFENMKFPRNTEMRIKEMIRCNDAGLMNEFPIVLAYLNIPNLLSNTITDIKHIDNEGISTFAFIAGGLLFYLYLKTEDMPETLNTNVLMSNIHKNEIEICVIPEKESINTLRDFYNN